MQKNSIPKRKRQIQCSQLKKTPSQHTLNKPTKRATDKKAMSSTLTTMASKSSLLKSLSPPTKSLKKNKKSKTINSQFTNVIAKIEKEPRKARQTSSKKSKKVSKKKQEISQKQEQLTQRKKVHQEYFMYKGTYVPIDNTQQRKVIFKIQLIDQKNQTRQISDRSFRMNSAATETQAKQVADKATQPSDRKNNVLDIQCQTDNKQDNARNAVKLNTQKFEEEEEQEKCFAQTLSELQFLYLPDEKNFQGFSKLEKAHYKQLLISIANKFQQPQAPPLDQEAIQILLSEREMKQRGIIESYPKEGLPTHTPSVISYVSNLFCFIQIYEKSFLIDRVNCSYGFSLIEKLQRLRSGQSTERTMKLIPQSTFWKFEADLHQGLDFQSQVIESSLHAHNKAIFDAVNEVLIQFQPYYSSQGEPFPWSESLETTFYCITQDSFGALVGQVKDKIWQFSNLLAGVILEVGTDMKYKTHIQKILSNQKNMLNSEIKKQKDKTEKDEFRTKVLCQISDYVEKELIKQMALLLSGFIN